MKNTYKDISIDFDRVNPLTGDIGTLTDDNAIKNSIKNLLLTNQKSIPFNRHKGTNLNYLLFEQNIGIVQIQASTLVNDILGYYEPRIKVNQVNASHDNYTLDIDIDYTILKTNEQKNVKIQVGTSK